MIETWLTHTPAADLRISVKANRKKQLSIFLKRSDWIGTRNLPTTIAD